MITGSIKKKFSLGIFSVLFVLISAIAAFTELYYLVVLPFILLFFYAVWQYPYFVFLLLLFSIPFSAEIQFSETLGTDFPDELLMIIASFLFLAYWLYHPSVLQKKIIKHPLIIVLILTLCWSLISVISSTQPLISFKFLLAKGWYVGAFVLAALIAFSQKQHIRSSIIAIVVAMVLVTLIIVVRHYQYGFSFEYVNDVPKPFFRNHVNYSAMLVCIIPIVFIYWQSVKKSKTGFLIGLLLIVLLAALYFSYARGAWLALFIGIIAVWLIKKKLLIVTYIIAVLVLLASVFWIKNNDRYLQYANDYKTTIWHKDFREHLIAMYHMKDVSTAERFYRWIAGVRMIKDNWLTGYGPGSFYNNYKPYAIPAFKTWVSNNEEHSTVHNYFLLVTIEQGIPGLIFFLLLAGMMLYYAQYLYHRIKDNFYKQVAITSGVILMIILAVNFLSDLVETDKIGSLFFLCLSMLVVTDVKTRGLNSSTDIQSVPQSIS